LCAESRQADCPRRQVSTQLLPLVKTTQVFRIPMDTRKPAIASGRIKADEKKLIGWPTAVSQPWPAGFFKVAC